MQLLREGGYLLYNISHKLQLIFTFIHLISVCIKMKMNKIDLFHQIRNKKLSERSCCDRLRYFMIYQFT